MNNAKKCPLCAEEIPPTATTCKYCGAQFIVTSTGYCQNCHQVREADGNGQCKICSNKLIDLRAESRLEESAQESLPISPPIAQNEISTEGRSCLPIAILAGILLLAVIGAVLWLGRNNIPAVSSLIATSTPTVTTTFTPTSTSTATLVPTATPTRTPRPTPMPTADQRVLNPANQHLYLYVKIPLAWHKARDYCASQGGHLATIQTSAENRFVYDLATKYNTEVGTWLGGTDEAEEGTWVWVTGEPWEYRDWLWSPPIQAEPDNIRGNPANATAEDRIRGADYLTFDSWDRTWQDWDDGQKYFVCEWEP